MAAAKKYLQIAQELRGQIEQHRLCNGDQIPTEKELTQRYHVSRMTANRAVRLLAAEGYVERVSGRGSYVCEKKIHKPITSSRSFTKDMEGIGCIASSRLLEYRLFRAHDLPELMQRMHLDADDFIYYFVRLRCGDDVPIAISYTYIPSSLIPAFDPKRLNASLYDYLSELGLIIHHGEGAMTAITASEEQKEALHTKDAALLKNTHYSYLENGEVIEYTETYYLGSRYEYHYDF